MSVLRTSQGYLGTSYSQVGDPTKPWAASSFAQYMPVEGGGGDDWPSKLHVNASSLKVGAGGGGGGGGGGGATGGGVVVVVVVVVVLRLLLLLLLLLTVLSPLQEPARPDLAQAPVQRQGSDVVLQQRRVWRLCQPHGH